MMLPRLYIITNQGQARQATGSLETTLRKALKAGARLIQLREKHLTHDQLQTLAEHLMPMVREHDARLLINTHASVARSSGADGVHRPADGPKTDNFALIGASAHSLAEAQDAEAHGADFITLSPIYESASKPGYGPPLGLDELSRVCQEIAIPVFALAGITPQRVEECMEAGAYGVAVMGGVMRAEDVELTVRAYLDAVDV
jgi:thiamine-phosphate pyrophosphorylase